MGTLLKYGCQHKHCCGSAAPFADNVYMYIIVPVFQRRRSKTSEIGLECPARLVDATRIRTSKITRWKTWAVIIVKFAITGPFRSQTHPIMNDRVEGQDSARRTSSRGDGVRSGKIQPRQPAWCQLTLILGGVYSHDVLSQEMNAACLSPLAIKNCNDC